MGVANCSCNTILKGNVSQTPAGQCVYVGLAPAGGGHTPSEVGLFPALILERFFLQAGVHPLLHGLINKPTLFWVA